MDHVIAILHFWLVNMHIFCINPLDSFTSNYENIDEENFCKWIVLLEFTLITVKKKI